jgi:alpha/beta superfamily hydrolase
MVGRGEVLERMTIVVSNGMELEGLYQRGGAAQPVVFAPPHPHVGGSMDSAVLSELVWTLARAGHPTLRFNYRGVGASRGTTTLPDLVGLPAPLPRTAIEGELADLNAAIEHHLHDRADQSCALVGYSVGALVAAIAAVEHPRVDRAVLIAPPTGVVDVDWAALANAGIPVTLLVGALDRQAPLEGVRAMVGPAFTVSSIENASHSFPTGLPELARRVRAAFPTVDDDDL